jgi:glucarate dehydratase
MKVTGIKVTPVTVPMEAPLRWNIGVEVGTTRAIVEVSTDEGITGIGETYAGNAVEHAIEAAKPYILGHDPLETRHPSAIAWACFASAMKPRCPQW